MIWPLTVTSFSDELGNVSILGFPLSDWVNTTKPVERAARPNIVANVTFSRLSLIFHGWRVRSRLSRPFQYYILLYCIVVRVKISKLILFIFIRIISDLAVDNPYPYTRRAYPFCFNHLFMKKIFAFLSPWSRSEWWCYTKKEAHEWWCISHLNFSVNYFIGGSVSVFAYFFKILQKDLHKIWTPVWDQQNFPCAPSSFSWPISFLYSFN